MLTFQLAVIHTNRIMGAMCTQKYLNSWTCCRTRVVEPFQSQPSQKSVRLPSSTHFVMMRYWNSFVSPYFILSCSCYHIWQGNVDIFSRILLHFGSNSSRDEHVLNLNGGASTWLYRPSELPNTWRGVSAVSAYEVRGQNFIQTYKYTFSQNFQSLSQKLRLKSLLYEI